MKFQKFNNKYIVRIDKGEEILETIKIICEQNQIKLGTVTGIGAVGKVKVGLFETITKQYHSTELEGDFEITSLMGSISQMNNEVYLHLHINISDPKYNTFGGHLNYAVVSATCEVVIDVIEGVVEREFSEEIGLNLYKF